MSFGEFRGYWDALNNRVLGSATDFLPDSSSFPAGGVRPGYYVVKVAGATMLDGNNVWERGDVALCTGFEWLRLRGSRQMQVTMSAYLTALNKIVEVPGASTKLEAAVPTDKSDPLYIAFHFSPYVKQGGAITKLTQSVFPGIDTDRVILAALDEVD